MEIISQYLSVVIVVICVVVGYVWKVCTPLANKYIPLVVTALGLILAIVNALTGNQPITLEVIAMGLVSGLASTGLHQFVTRVFEKMEQLEPKE